MKLSAIAAHAIMIVGVAAAQSLSVDTNAGAPTAEPVERVSVARTPCAGAVWPYLPAECVARTGVRPVRVVRAEVLR